MALIPAHTSEIVGEVDKSLHSALDLGTALSRYGILKRLLALTAVSCVSVLCSAQNSAGRPAITGVSHMTIYASDLAATKKFYGEEIGLTEGAPDSAGRARYFASTRQYIAIAPLPANHDLCRLESVAFVTADAEGLRRYLAAHGVQVPGKVSRERDGRTLFYVKDPEGHSIGFEQGGATLKPATLATAAFTRMIHVGFVVHNRQAEDAFFKDVLGFRPYWHGGRNGTDEWISLQVPEGSDWIEYMINNDSTPNQHTLGVLNHFSLGVVDIHQAQHVIESHGWHETAEEQAKIGRDGKWQLNVYDPDQTRVEFMEFKPTQPPCCSEFTASHPQP